MDIKQILEHNAQFYESYAKEFSDTRQSAWPGWSQLSTSIKTLTSNSRILDLGCGNGRFYRFLNDLGYRGQYFGIDSSCALINIAKKDFSTEDFRVGNCLEFDPELGKFDLVCGFGIMHHIFPSSARIKFIESAAEYLKKDSKLVLTFWTEKPQNAVEMGDRDFKIKWQTKDNAYRYAHIFTFEEIENIKHKLVGSLNCDKQFASDGKNKSSNLYVIWSKL